MRREEEGRKGNKRKRDKGGNRECKVKGYKRREKGVKGKKTMYREREGVEEERQEGKYRRFQ